MGFTWILDHIVYIPIIGLIALLIAAIEDLDAKFLPTLRLWGVVILAASLVLLTIQSNQYAGKFINAETLDRYALSIDPDSNVLHSFLGGALQDKGDYSGAIQELQIALRIRSYDAETRTDPGPTWNESSDDGPIHAQLGDIFMATHRFPEAVGEYQEAIRLHHQPVEMLANEGTALIMEGDVAEGTSEIKKAATIDPSCVIAQYNLGKALCLQGDIAGGIERYRQAIKLQPEYVDAYNNLGVALFHQGNISAAAEEFQQALKVDPDFVESRNNLQLLERMQNSNQ